MFKGKKKEKKRLAPDSVGIFILSGIF